MVAFYFRHAANASHVANTFTATVVTTVIPQGNTKSGEVVYFRLRLAFFH